MIRTLLPVLIFLAVPAAAQTVPRVLEGPCIADEGPHSCVKNLACIGDEGRWFEGRAFGWGSGVLVGRTSDGVVCEGTWEIEPSGYGRTEVACEDGTSAEVVSEYQDYETGTSIGRGITSSGEEIRSFSGENVVEYLTEDGIPVLPCGDAGIELDKDGIPIS